MKFRIQLEFYMKNILNDQIYHLNFKDRRTIIAHEPSILHVAP
jgi:hypothetical protein